MKQIYHDVDIRIVGREAQPYFKTACSNISLPVSKHGSIDFGAFSVKMDLKKFLLTDSENKQCFVKIQLLWNEDLPSDKINADAIISLHLQALGIIYVHVDYDTK